MAQKSLVIRQNIVIESGYKVVVEDAPAYPEVIRWDEEVKFQSDGTAPFALRSGRANFARFSKSHALNLTIEADLVAKDASSSVQLAVAIDEGDDSSPPSNFFSQVETASDRWAYVSLTSQVPLPSAVNSRSVIRLVGVGEGSVKNVVLTFSAVDETASAASK